MPTCPEWTLLDLVRHLGGVHRFWATVVAAGPADAPPAERSAQLSSTAHREREALLAWSAESTELLLSALREAGPDRGCWTWWPVRLHCRQEASTTGRCVSRSPARAAGGGCCLSPRWRTGGGARCGTGKVVWAELVCPEAGA